MAKPLKVAAIVVGIVVALIAIAIVAAIVLIDPNRYRGEIIQAVKTHTGRDLKIDGDLRLSFFPWLGLETGRLELANAQGFGNEPFARVESAGVKVALLPLLRKEVIVDAVRLNGLRLNLARAANGRSNWDDLVQAKPGAAPAQPKPTGGGAAAAAALSVNRVEVRDAEFTYRDQVSGAAYAARRVELTSGNVLGEHPAPLHLAFDLESGKPKITRRVELSAQLSADLATEKVNVPELRLTAGDLSLNAQLRGTDVIKAPKLNGRVEIPAFNLRALLGELGVAYAPADANALKKVALVSQLDYGPQAVSAHELRLTLDDTSLTGRVAMQQQPRTSYRFDLVLDSIDVDRYLPSAAKKAEKTSEQTADKKPADKSQDAAPVVIPLALLRETDAEGQLRVQKLKAFGIRSEQVGVKVAARGGRISLGPNEARLYGGVYAGRTTIDASTSTPKFQFDEKLTGLQLGPFLKDAQIFDKFSGAGNVTIALTGQGLNADAIKRTLNGSVAVAIKDGAIEGVDLQKIEAKIKEVRDQPGGTAKNLLTSLPALGPEKGDKTTFSKLQASGTVTNGVVQNKDLAIQAPRLNITGSGNVNLVADRYENYRLLVGNFPIIVSGPLAAPKFSPDWNAILKGQVEQRKEKALEQGKEKVRDRFRDLLKRR
ncbi:MAG: AsmA family protein [Sulfurifustis sp.]